MSRKYDVQPGADQVAKWKAALTQHKRNQRRNRWKRSAPAYRPGMNIRKTSTETSDSDL
jgi:hypothetical protein